MSPLAMVGIVVAVMMVGVETRDDVGVAVLGPVEVTGMKLWLLIGVKHGEEGVETAGLTSETRSDWEDPPEVKEIVEDFFALDMTYW